MRRRRAALAGAVLGALVALAWLTQTPPRERVPHFADQPVANIAHAGAQGHAPANTLEAFELALVMGADTLEMDAQVTADSEVVLHHDGTVDRQTDGAGAIADLPLDELKELDAGFTFQDDAGEFPWRGRGVEIPTLEEVFEAFPDTYLVVELKTDGGPGIVDAVAERIEAHDRQDTVLVASFDLDYLQAFRERLPGVPTSMPEEETRRFYTLQLVGAHRWWRPPAGFFQVPEHHEGTHVVTGRFVRAADRLGVDVQVWTVNEVEDMRRLIDLGVHGIMTDYPDRLTALLDELPDAPTETAVDPVGLRASRWLQEHLGWLTPLLLAVTRLGDAEFYLLVFPLLYWCVSGPVGIRVGVMLLLSAGVNAVAKLGTASPRPFFLDPDVGLSAESSFGIPSGHAQNGVAVWGLLAAEAGRMWAWVAALLLILLLGVSRVHLGVHFPEDVLIGWAIGAVLLVAFLRWRAPVTAWLAARSAAAQVAAAFIVSVAFIAVAAVVRTSFTGWTFPAAWVGAGDLEGATGLGTVVTPAAALFGVAVGLVLLARAGGFDTAGPVWQRIARFPVGLVGVLVLLEGLGAVLPGGESAVALAARYLHYALLGAWITGLAPLLFTRLGIAPTARAERPVRVGAAQDPQT
jgi:glycerophosphoryl diester phosphodiesterase/membrane-associated phospholipid phosphatase